MSGDQTPWPMIAGRLANRKRSGYGKLGTHWHIGCSGKILSTNKAANACERYGWYCHAYCLMTNHYHLLIETNRPTLSKGVKYLNGTYTQHFNRRNKRVGHVFQGRYKAILVQKENFLLELARYIVLIPVRTRMVCRAVDWPWSSYRATAGYRHDHALLTTDWLLAAFAKGKKEAQIRYRRFVQEGKNQPSAWESLKNQVFLGTDQFVEDMQCKINPKQ
ncbi:MAG: hypothetical protein HKP12_00490 [Gammaproteobacteria bacterium]|nr:hypothetical protein [Gammaproteobacteria bacterium]